MRFLLVDGIAALEPGRSIRGWKNAALSEDYFEWHFPERPIVPGALVLEACVQLAGWLEAADSDAASWALLARVRSARYYDFALPGDRIDLSVQRLPDPGEDRRGWRAETNMGARRGATLEFETRVVPLADLHDAAVVRRTLAALRGGRP
jgi:3-hydroxyacyl-[acyl-carrier-protein] dehydratase